MGGPTGLDYAGVRAYLKEEIRKPAKRKQVFSCLRAAERGYLEGLCEAEQQKKQNG